VARRCLTLGDSASYHNVGSRRKEHGQEGASCVLRAEALAILAGDEKGFDHLGVYEVAVELIQLA
jgi:hypothetical protein